MSTRRAWIVALVFLAGSAARGAWQNEPPPAQPQTTTPAEPAKPSDSADKPDAAVPTIEPPVAEPTDVVVGSESKAYPMPDLAPAVQRLLEEPYLTDAERRAIRVRHGQWTSDDLRDGNDLDSVASAALIAGWYDDPSLTNEKTSALLRARGELARGQYALAVDRLTTLCADPKTRTLLTIRLRAEGLEALGRAAEADAALDPLVERMGELAHAETWADADEIAEGVRGLMLRTKFRGPEKEGGGDFKAMQALLERARETVDKLNWNVALAEAELLADKDNYPDAAAALASALTLNPRLGEAWAMLGQMAVNGFDIERAEQIAARLDENVADLARLEKGTVSEVTSEAAPVQPADGSEPKDAQEVAAAPAPEPPGPGSVDGAMVLARARLRQKDPVAAIALLDPWVSRYPTRLDLVSLRAAASAAGFDFADTDARLKAIDAISPLCPVGYCEVGRTLAEERQYEEAATYLGEAAKRMPHWGTPVVELGLLEVQSGRNDRALAALDRAAKLDPFNVRVLNSLKLIEDLKGFVTVESPHFVVRYHPGVDEVLAKEMPPILERIYKRVTGSEPGGIRHEPKDKTVIELMPDHHWFSVRITGMPKLHTIAAATGPLVAMEAPRSGPGHLVGPYDWPRVVQHEFTHTVTLSRTKNRLPHWFTEAAAVYLEDSPRDWSTVQLLSRTVENNELFNLDDINIGFIRPKRPTDRQLAYAQGHWMYQYIVEKFGAEAPLKLMDAYAAGTKEEQAFGSILGVTRDQFLKEFTVWAKAQLVSWGMVLPEGTPSVQDLLTQHNTLVTSQGGEAADEPTQEMVDQWLEKYPNHPDLLRAAVDFRLKASGDVVTEDLVPWLERYAAARPPDPMPHKLLAKYYLDGKGSGREAAFPHLRFLDQREQHSPTYAMELARLLLAKGDAEGASAMASRAVAIAPYDASVREFAATIAMQRKDLDEAERHIRALIELEPDRAIHKQRLEALLKIKAAKAEAK